MKIQTWISNILLTSTSDLNPKSNSITIQLQHLPSQFQKGIGQIKMQKRVLFDLENEIKSFVTMCESYNLFAKLCNTPLSETVHLYIVV